MHRPLSVRTLQIYYYRYKDTPYFMIGVFSIVLIISFVLILLVIIPQFQYYLSIQREVDAVEKSISTMQENREYLSSVSDLEEQEQSDIVMSALPITRDYGGIYTAITTAAANSGVGLANFQYQIGGQDDLSVQGNTVLEMEIRLLVSGAPQSITQFLTHLQQLLPLSTVSTIAGESGTANVAVSFFYGGEQLIQVDAKQPIPKLTDEKRELLSILSSYRPPVELIVSESPISTGSAFSQTPF